MTSLTPKTYQMQNHPNYEKSVDSLYNSTKRRIAQTSLKLPGSNQAYDFKDPSTLSFWMEDYMIDTENTDSFLRLSEANFEHDYLSLRNRQNKIWAHQSSLQGHEIALKNEYNSAMKKYQSALDMDPDCVEAFIGRANVLMESRIAESSILEDNLAVGVENSASSSDTIAHRLAIAISDVKRALEIDPGHKFANKLYHDMKIKSQQQEEKRDQLELGEYLMPIGLRPSEARKLNVFEAPRRYETLESDNTIL